MFKHKSYIIETLTNTHVGSGDTSFGTVDNLIQKDPATSLPVFHSSSIKGAIKEHMENNYKNTEIPEENLNLIFGKAEDKPGVVKFYDARLLTLPLRASRMVYFNCTSPETVLDYMNAVKTFMTLDEGTIKNIDNLIAIFSDMRSKFSGIDFYIFDSNNGVEIEDYESFTQWKDKVNEIKDDFNKYFLIDLDTVAVFKDEIFSYICENSLPVIARNKIGDYGTSENLFYEEVLPRRSRLWFMLGFDSNITINSQFEAKLTSDLIQMGANASIGYGVTRINKVV